MGLNKTPPELDDQEYQEVADNEIQDLTPHITAAWRESSDQCLLDLLPRPLGLEFRKGKDTEISTS